MRTLISCGRCHDELRSTTVYEPPHEIRHRHDRVAPLPVSDDCSPWLPGSSADGALANVAFESTFIRHVHRRRLPRPWNLMLRVCA